MLKDWLQQGDYQLKFVVGSSEDIHEIDALLASIDVPVAPHKVLLMPEGVTSAVLRGKSLALVELCKERGFRFSDRLHVHLFGQQRGT